MPEPFEDFFCRSPDGLKLHAKVFGRDTGSALPVLCLPGLTRTADDFDEIASALAFSQVSPRKVVAIDYRGRGLSDHDADPAKYTVPVEMGDVLTIAGALGIARTILIGTSRGGLISMLLAATQPSLLAGVVLNDIGPVLNTAGLMKIKGYLKDPPPRSTWDDAASGLQDLFGDAFPNLKPVDWMAWARRAFRQDGKRLVRTYDLRIANGFADLDPAKPPAPLWDLFDALAGIPLMLVHGQLSDLLSPQGVKDMLTRRPDIDLVTVADQGHAPLLADVPTIQRIAAFCDRCDSQAGTSAL